MVTILAVGNVVNPFVWGIFSVEVVETVRVDIYVKSAIKVDL